MNNDRSESHQIRLDPQQLLELNLQLGDMPLEMTYYGPEMDLTSLDSVLRLISFSQKILRYNYPDREKRIQKAWLCIAMVICDNCPWDDKRTYALGCVEELARLADTAISEDEKRSWYSQLYPGIHNDRYPRTKYAKNE